MGHSNLPVRRSVLRSRQRAKRVGYVAGAITAVLLGIVANYGWKYYSDDTPFWRSIYAIAAFFCIILGGLIAFELAYRASQKHHRGQWWWQRTRAIGRHYLYGSNRHGHLDNAGHPYNHDHEGGTTNHDHEGTTKLYFPDPWPEHYLKESEK